MKYLTSENNVDVQYQKMLTDILEHGNNKYDESRDIMTKSIFGYMMHIDMYKKFPAVTTKKLAFKSVVGELINFLRGESNIKFMKDNNIHIWDDDASNYHNMDVNEWREKVKSDSSLYNVGAFYGVNWRDFFGVDQIKNSLEVLKYNPKSRRNIVTAWNPPKLGDVALPPCHYSFLFGVEEMTTFTRAFNIGLTMEECINIIDTIDKDKNYNVNDNEKFRLHLDEVLKAPKYLLNCQFNMRSWDVFLGAPFNIASYALLTYLFAEICNMTPNTLVSSSTDTHIYANHYDQCKLQLQNDPSEHTPPTLSFSQKLKDNISKYNNNEITLDQLIFSLEISDFILNDYTSYGKISGKMLAPNK